jgi:hypothetical protein
MSRTNSKDGSRSHWSTLLNLVVGQKKVKKEIRAGVDPILLVKVTKVVLIPWQFLAFFIF